MTSWWDQYLKPGPSEARDVLMQEMMSGYGDVMVKNKDMLGPALGSSMGRNSPSTDMENARRGASPTVPQPNAIQGASPVNPLQGFMKQFQQAPQGSGSTPLQQLIGGGARLGIGGLANMMQQPGLEDAASGIMHSGEALPGITEAWDPAAFAAMAAKPLGQLVGGKIGGKAADAAATTGLAAAEGFTNPVTDAMALWKILGLTGLFG